MSVVTGLSVAAGRFDVTNNALVIDYSGASPAGQVAELLRDGYNGGAWTGSGIISSMANAAFGVGLVEASTLEVVPPIFGTVDPSILGTCSAARHDAWSVDGGDGFRYRTWHPQVDSTGCVYAHEHGDNPAAIKNAEIAAVPPRFGYIGRRHPMPGEPAGHDEPHEGFMVLIANPGDRNDEGRVNWVYSRSVFHMGTGGPKRFAMRHHSAEIRLIHPEFGLKAFTQLMMDTGGTATVCDPRVNPPTKDVVQLNSPCRLASAYEIWGTSQSVRSGGREVYRSFATPAVFDPITHLVKNYIHFEFKDRSRMDRAFEYVWRFWTLPELRELLLEAGFSDVQIYWDTATEDDEEKYAPRTRAENQPGWLAYIVAHR